MGALPCNRIRRAALAEISRVSPICLSWSDSTCAGPACALTLHGGEGLRRWAWVWVLGTLFDRVNRFVSEIKFRSTLLMGLGILALPAASPTSSCKVLILLCPQIRSPLLSIRFCTFLSLSFRLVPTVSRTIVKRRCETPQSITYVASLRRGIGRMIIPGGGDDGRQIGGR